MGSYRFVGPSSGSGVDEASAWHPLAPSNRSGCTNKECKDEKVKIAKGELRLGSWIENERFQGYQWRHWGCVTPKVIENITNSWKETLPSEEPDYSLLDGYDELPEDVQLNIRTALTQGHVDDADWRGDLEVNRPGKTGFRVRGAAKKAKEKKATLEQKTATTEGSDANDDTDAADKAKAKAKPKPKPKPKKAAAKDVPESSNDADASLKVKPKAKNAGRGKKAAANEDPEASGSEKEEQKPAANTKKPRAKEAATGAVADAQPKARGRPTKTKRGQNTATETTAQPAKKGTKRKTSDEDAQDSESDKPKRTRAKAGKSSLPDDDEPAPPTRPTRGRKKAPKE
ncbi:hypothetical protein PENDEC_c005G02547 [Penicillium decumbens]|uniref:PARP-type domain-containing protein n=1 Tax=Penicillium decumbens TaxID=69771 RepID=A0A1V6PI33_PENDC|nr:hypothetical protein PENDEC_c005G02547 [Penicillium decumbens]